MTRGAAIAGWAAGAGVILGLLAAVEAAVRLGAVKRVLVPPPTEIAGTLGAVLAEGALWEPLGHTLYLLFTAYLLSSALAVALGLAMGRSEALYNLFDPLVEFVRPLPKPALLPPLILLLGIGDAMKIAIVSLAVFFPVLINTVQGARGVDPVLLGTARTFGYSPGRTVALIVLPASLPFVFAGLRVALGLGLVVVVVAEMLAGTGGIGYVILDMQRTFLVKEMYAWLVILAALGFGLNALFVALERRVLFWT